MTEEQNKGNKEIDLTELLLKVWANRKFVIKVCSISLVVGLVIAFSIPKEYTTKVILAPEVTGKSGLSGSMGALASMVGVNLGNTGSEDAISPELYPKIIESTPFLTGLFNVKMVTKNGDLSTTLYNYLDKHQKTAWWGSIIGAPGKLFIWGKSLFSTQNLKSDSMYVNAYCLTEKQSDIAEAIKNTISTSVDKKTDVITIIVTAQDPLISATLADSVMLKLQQSITEYRTNKARKDLIFAEKLYKEAQNNYYKAQNAYASYVDGNMNMALARYEIEEDRLKNEQTLSYNVYSQVAQQLQIAKAKVQEQTPVYTVVQPSTVPLIASSPKKILILIGIVFLAFAGSLTWIFFRRI